MKIRALGMAVAFTSIAFLGYFSWSFSTFFDSPNHFLWALISLCVMVDARSAAAAAAAV
jgi:hypothetical protein